MRLAVHLVFATTTFVLWLTVILRAWTKFPTPPGPNEHSRFHRRWGTVAAPRHGDDDIDRLALLLARLHRVNAVRRPAIGG